MSKISKYSNRFVELVNQAEEIEATKYSEDASWGRGQYVDDNRFLNWKTKAKNLLSVSCSEQSEHYKSFINCEKPSMYTTNYESLLKLKSIFLAAKEDYDGGYLKSVRDIVQAEVFDSELEQATELLSNGYYVAAAVVAGVVLETTLRGMCVDKNIGTGKLDKMNSDLCKAGVYNMLMQKRITALADIRNNAAHGHQENFKAEDVKDMISKIEAFVADHL